MLEVRCFVGQEASDAQIVELLAEANGDVQAAINLYFERPPLLAAAPRAAATPPAAATAATAGASAACGFFAQAGKRARAAEAAPRAVVAAPRAVVAAEPTPPTAPAPRVPRPSTAPLAERMRPTQLDELLGQEAALNDLLSRAVREDVLPSLLLWGPPGCGKTSFAHIISRTTRRTFRAISAAKAGVAEVRAELARAAGALKLGGARTVLFVDEIHRWSKAQQDALLGELESGVITLVGATTENPSFSINNAILSRCRLIVFETLAVDALVAALRRALACDAALAGVEADDDVLRALAAAAGGDARVALNALELAAVGAADDDAPPRGAPAARRISLGAVARAVQSRALYDRQGDFHYDLISAVHKSLRGGDADASLYYVCRMLEAGEEPRYVTRRLIRFAAEDVGLADPLALPQALAADQAVAAIGMPEAGVCIAQAVVYLALAPKSCAVYRAYNAAAAACAEAPRAAVPLHIRNAPTKLMKSIGYGDGYAYNPSQGYARGCEQGYLPSALVGTRFFDPHDCEPGEHSGWLPLRRSGQPRLSDADALPPGTPLTLPPP